MIRTLVVDDDARLRFLIRCILEDDGGFTVVGEAGDGVQGIEQARRTQPDLVLLDVSMPRMDGFEAMPHIRRTAPAAIIVVVSMLPEEEVRPKALSLGAALTMDKALSSDEIVARLREVMQQARDHGTAAALLSR